VQNYDLQMHLVRGAAERYHLGADSPSASLLRCASFSV